MFDLKLLRPVIVGFFCCLVALPLSASPRVALDYRFQAEAHDNQEDRVYSIIEFGLADNYASSRLIMDYDITSGLIYEHQEGVDNIQWNGTLASNYKFTPSLSWVLDIDVTEINLEDNTEIDLINSQTFTTTSTGLEYSVDRSIRGSLVIGVFTRLYTYEDSPLDGDENTFELIYTYPFNSTSSLITSASRIDQQYDEPSESINDAINDRLRIGYQKRFSRLSFDIFIDQNSIDYSNRHYQEDIEGYGLGIDYQVNSRSSLSLDLGKQIEQVFSVNENLIDPQNSLLTSGLVENQSASVQYDYRSNFNTFSMLVYQNDIKYVDETADDDLLKGSLINYLHNFNTKVSLGINYEQYENGNGSNDYELSTYSLIYQINKTHRTTSSISLIVEEGTENEINNDDNIIQFNFTGKIY